MRKVVAVIGGAVSGAETAKHLSERGATVVVFERGSNAYGKIAEGLPRWHSKLRQREYERIEERLSLPNVHVRYNVEIGSDLLLDELINEWKFSAVVLANGAQKDRPLQVPGVEKFLGKGIEYQNDFVRWWNELPAEENAADTRAKAGAVVLGGGLASIDVGKIIQVENYRKALAERGFEIDVETCDHKGLPKICAMAGVDPAELNIPIVRLVYRRGVQNMPLAPKVASTPEQEEKARNVARRLMGNVTRDFFVELIEYSQAVEFRGTDQLESVVIEKLEPGEGRKLTPTGDTTELKTSLVISSIGSIPSPMPGIPMKGELYDIEDYKSGSIRGLDGVFCLGNVLTGQGNIRDSRFSARDVSKKLADEYLGLVDEAQVDAIMGHAKDADFDLIKEKLKAFPS